MTNPASFTDTQGSRFHNTVIGLFTMGTIILAGVLSLAQLGIAFS